MSDFEKELKRLTKSEIIAIAINERQRADEQFDRSEYLQSEVDEFELELDEKTMFEDVLNVAKDIMGRMKDARWKLSLGNLHEQEEIDKLMEKLEGTLSC